MFCQKFRKYHCLFVVINFATKDPFFLIAIEKIDFIFSQHGYSEYNPKSSQSSLQANITWLKCQRQSGLHFCLVLNTIHSTSSLYFFSHNTVRKFHLIHLDMQLTKLRSLSPCMLQSVLIFNIINKFRIALLSCKLYYVQKLFSFILK